MNGLQTARARVEGAIEHLIAVLDRLDGDCDLEPDMASFDPSYMDDREGDDERDCDLAGSHSDLEADEGEYDSPRPMTGGQGL